MIEDMAVSNLCPAKQRSFSIFSDIPRWALSSATRWPLQHHHLDVADDPTSGQLPDLLLVDRGLFGKIKAVEIAQEREAAFDRKPTTSLKLSGLPRHSNFPAQRSCTASSRPAWLVRNSLPAMMTRAVSPVISRDGTG
jgi:hypothetical protein